MFTLSQEQIDALREARFQRYVSTMIDHLYTRFPEKTALLSSPTLREIVLEGILSAESCSIIDANDTRRYLEYYFEFDGPLGQARGTEWAREIISSHCSGTEKMDRIDDVDLFDIRLPEQTL
jgi:hypothetical protein